MSHLLNAFLNLRPGALFKDGIVNGSSLETITETFIGSDNGNTIPSIQEIEAEIQRISNEDLPKEEARLQFENALSKEEIMLCFLDLYDYIKDGTPLPADIQQKINVMRTIRNSL